MRYRQYKRYCNGMNTMLRKLAGRVPKYTSGDRDIVEQLNYVASQVAAWRGTREGRWMQAHVKPLEDAAKEIRRLRALLYAPGTVPEGERPPDYVIGTQAGWPSWEAYAASRPYSGRAQ